ncbi:hypothetical protein Hte_007833 [Hypoxylon texense]
MKFKRHVATHQEQVAIFVLPRSTDPEADGETASENGTPSLALTQSTDIDSAVMRAIENLNTNLNYSEDLDVDVDSEDSEFIRELQKRRKDRRLRRVKVGVRRLEGYSFRKRTFGERDVDSDRYHSTGVESASSTGAGQSAPQSQKEDPEMKTQEKEIEERMREKEIRSEERRFARHMIVAEYARTAEAEVYNDMDMYGSVDGGHLSSTSTDRSTAPQLTRDLLPSQRGANKPDSHSVFNQSVLDEDPITGEQVLRRRKSSTVEAETDVEEKELPLRKRQSNPPEESNQDKATEENATAAEASAAAEKKHTSPNSVESSALHEPPLTTNTFKNSHFNAAHYNNMNFQPEIYRADADDEIPHAEREMTGKGVASIMGSSERRTETEEEERERQGEDDETDDGLEDGYPRSPHSHSHPKPDGRSSSPPSRHNRALDSANRHTPSPAPSFPSILNPEPTSLSNIPSRTAAMMSFSNILSTAAKPAPTTTSPVLESVWRRQLEEAKLKAEIEARKKIEDEKAAVVADEAANAAKAEEELSFKKRALEQARLKAGLEAHEKVEGEEVSTSINKTAKSSYTPPEDMARPWEENDDHEQDRTARTGGAAISYERDDLEHRDADNKGKPASGDDAPLPAETLRRLRRVNEKNTGGGFYKYRCKYFYTHNCPNWVYENYSSCASCYVPTGTVVEVGNAKIHSQDGGEINIVGHNIGATRNSSNHSPELEREHGHGPLALDHHERLGYENDIEIGHVAGVQDAKEDIDDTRKESTEVTRDATEASDHRGCPQRPAVTDVLDEKISDGLEKEKDVVAIAKLLERFTLQGERNVANPKVAASTSTSKDAEQEPLDQIFKLNHHKNYRNWDNLCPHGCGVRFSRKRDLARHLREHCHKSTIPGHLGDPRAETSQTNHG